MLNLNLLKTLIAVVEEGTLSAAAEKLGLSQPTITLHIQNLEDDLAVKLLARRAKGVGLTREGEVVVRKAKELLSFCETVEAELFEELCRTKVQLRVGAGPIMTDHILPHVVAGFQQIHPGLEVVIEPGETAAIAKGVLDHTYDIGFVGFPVECDQLELIEWIEDELLLVVPTNHSFVKRGSVKANELEGQNIIWHKSASGIKMYVQNELCKMGVNVATENGNGGEASSTMSLLSSVNAGLGVAIIPRYSAENAIDMGMVSSVRIEDVSLVRKLYIATTRRSHKSLIIAEFIEAATSYAHRNGSTKRSV